MNKKTQLILFVYFTLLHTKQKTKIFKQKQQAQ